MRNLLGDAVFRSLYDERGGRVQAVPYADPYTEDLRFPAQGINPPGAVTDPVRDTNPANFPGTLLFSGSADNMIAGTAQLPHAWRAGVANDGTARYASISPHIHWTRTTTSALAVQWGFLYRIFRRGQAPTAWSVENAGSEAVPQGDVADGEGLWAFPDIDLTGYPVSTSIAWILYRRGDTDAYNADARLIELDFHYEANKPGTTSAYTGE